MAGTPNWGIYSCGAFLTLGVTAGLTPLRCSLLVSHSLPGKYLVGSSVASTVKSHRW